MDQPVAMRRAEAQRDLAGVRAGPRRGDGSAREDLLERPAVVPGHDQVGGAVFVAAEVVDRADVAVLEGRGGLGLALEPGTGPLVVRQLGRQKLDRDPTLEALVPGLPHAAHGPAAQDLDKSVV